MIYDSVNYICTNQYSLISLICAETLKWRSEVSLFFFTWHWTFVTLRPCADQSSKAAFGKSAFAKTCFLLFKIRLAHINRAKSKNHFEHFWHVSERKHFARCMSKTCSKVLLLFARLVCTSPTPTGEPPMLLCYITICNDGFIERSERVS